MDLLNMGIVYLIQTAETRGTNIFKVGMSNECSTRRCRTGYNDGTRIITICGCFKPLNLVKISSLQ